LVLAHNFTSQTTRKIKIKKKRELRGKERKKERIVRKQKKDVQRLTSAERRNERDGEMLF